MEVKAYYMKSNLGKTDRAIRILAAVVLVALVVGGIIPAGVAAIIAWILAAILLLTSFISFCPLYALFNISTEPKDM